MYSKNALVLLGNPLNSNFLEERQMTGEEERERETGNKPHPRSLAIAEFRMLQFLVSTLTPQETFNIPFSLHSSQLTES